MEYVDPGSLEPTTREKNIKWAEAHVALHPNELFVMDGVDASLTPLTIESQNEETSYVEGAPLASSAEISEIVSSVDSRFPEIVEKLHEMEEDSSYVSDIGKELNNGNNVVILTNHEQITDLGFVLAAFVSALKEEGIDFRSGAIVSKMAPFLGRIFHGKIMGLTDVLALGCNDIYLGYPDTSSRRNAGITDDMSNRHNFNMLKSLLNNLRRGGNLLVIDPTGTTNKPSPDGLVKIGDVGSATEGILKRERVKVTSAGIWVTEKSLTFAPNGMLVTVGKNKAEGEVTMHDYMLGFVKSLNDAVDPSEARFVLNSAPSNPADEIRRMVIDSE